MMGAKLVLKGLKDIAMGGLAWIKQDDQMQWNTDQI